MGGMPLNDMPWWRWRANVRSALHMLSDPVFQEEVWLTGAEGYGDVTDAVYRLVEDTWLDSWSADKYVGTIFRDAQEAALVDLAVLRVLRILHQVGPDAPSPRTWSTTPGPRRYGPRARRTYGWRRRTGRIRTRRPPRSTY